MPVRIVYVWEGVHVVHIGQCSQFGMRDSGRLAALDVYAGQRASLPRLRYCAVPLRTTAPAQTPVLLAAADPRQVDR